QPLGQDDELGADGERGKAGHYKSFATVVGCDYALGGDLRGGVVVAQEQGLGRDVALRAVRVAGPHDHLLGRALTVQHCALPWQLPLLQPAFMKTGITSSRKLIGRSSTAPLTLTGTTTTWPPNATRMAVTPSRTG